MLSFNLTEEQEMIRQMARNFAKEGNPPGRRAL